jgi:hypothetical protein
MDASELKPGMVALTNNNDIVIITGFKAGKYPIIFKKGDKSFCGAPSDFKDVVGMADLKKFEQVIGASDFAPDSLKGVNVGDPIMVLQSGKPVPAIFRGYFPSRPQYPVAITMNGKQYKIPARLVVQKAA